jgi:hypothetical protein
MSKGEKHSVKGSNKGNAQKAAGKNDDSMIKDLKEHNRPADLDKIKGGTAKKRGTL